MTKKFWKRQIDNSIFCVILLAAHAIAINITDGIELMLTVLAVIILILNLINGVINTLIEEDKNK